MGSQVVLSHWTEITKMSAKSRKKNKYNFLMRMRPVLRWVLRLRSTPKAIAGGLGLGTFIAFTPTMGMQLILAVLGATFFNLNRPAAVIPVWITNPITVAPIYTFNYWLGRHIWEGPPLTEVSRQFLEIGRTMARLSFWDIKVQIIAVLSMGRDVLIPLVIGSLAIGLITGILVYLFSYRLLCIFLFRRGKKRLLNNN